MDGAPAEVAAYFASIPDGHRSALEAVRTVVREAVPEAVESISYGVPTFKYRGRPLIYFGAAKKHCAIYGTSLGSTYRFPPGEPPAAEVIQGVLAERMAEIDAAASRQKKPASGPPG